MEISVDRHEVIDSINLSLTVQEARELAGLLAAVPVGTTTDTFDNIADSIAQQLDFDVPHYSVDENGEFGPSNAYADAQGCGCGFSDETDAA